MSKQPVKRAIERQTQGSNLSTLEAMAPHPTAEEQSVSSSSPTPSSSSASFSTDAFSDDYDVIYSPFYEQQQALENLLTNNCTAPLAKSQRSPLQHLPSTQRPYPLHTLAGTDPLTGIETWGSDEAFKRSTGTIAPHTGTLVQPEASNGPDAARGGRPNLPMLHLAALNGNRGVAATLLKYGATVDASDALNRTALHIAVERDDEALVSLLLKAGADVQACDMRGRNALYIAVSSGNNDIVEMLLKHGCAM
ncbi:hypothetical protein DL771_009988 [Monosporascus sp. 5C6A]|nr:hypothetical protein DL771_009988 [Monosporascus sp. 5C6A]